VRKEKKWTIGKELTEEDQFEKRDLVAHLGGARRETNIGGDPRRVKG